MTTKTKAATASKAPAAKKTSRKSDPPAKAAKGKTAKPTEGQQLDTAATGKPVGKETPTPTVRGPSTTQMAALGLLAKAGKPMSRSEISKALDGAFIGGKVMGHANAAKLRKTSLVGRGLAKFAAVEEGAATAYEITPAGKKALEAAKGGK